MYHTKGICVVLLALAVVLKTSEACSCMPAHPQEHFCKAEFVILATVKREFLQEYNKIYKVRIRKEFKMSEKAKIALKSGRVYTALHDSMCGVDLKPKTTYIITGQLSGLQPFVSLCGLTKPWSEVSHRQRKGFKLLYGRGCDCKLRKLHTVCLSQGCLAARNDTCAWHVGSQCQTDHGICLRNAGGQCHWTKSLALKKCSLGGRREGLGGPDPYQRPREIKEEILRTEPNRYQRVGYYHYNKIAN